MTEDHILYFPKYGRLWTGPPSLGGASPGKAEVLAFQGEWFVLGLAGSTHSPADRPLLSPFTATFEKNKTKQLEVTYAMMRGQRCVTWSYVLIPTAQPGVFSGALAGGPLTGLCPPELGTDTEEVWVHETNYSTFALTSSRRRSVHRSILRVHLLCEPLPSPSLPAAAQRHRNIHTVCAAASPEISL
ncbi:PREDICTED: epididymal-specific lipocalin-12 [Myotis davidii]|uniref:epididymal-specific lipocalin-12 n=1 Tax=Myotis davidii TaxID=225400 RepID=UPI000766F696|nr:PREDICTED: epididymal-specific lipocalin-12 [Myotis davidii]